MKVEADFHIITGHVTAVKNIIKCVEKAGLNPVDIILEPIASSEAVLTNEEKEAGICLVDIGGGTTDVAIFQDGIIRHTAVIPFGGDIITEDIKEGCTIIKNQAELLKVKFGSALAIENQENEIVSIPGLRGREPKEISIKNLANIIQARVEEIIEQVYFEIKNSGYEKKLIGGIVITGGGSLLKHISQLIEFTTGKYVRIGYPNEHLAPSKANDITSPIFATSVGLIIVGLNEAEKSGGNKNTFEIKSPEQEPIISVKEEEIKVEVKPKVEKTEKEKRSGNLLDFFRKFFEDDTE
jgi:cell division protein FtsA